MWKYTALQILAAFSSVCPGKQSSGRLTLRPPIALLYKLPRCPTVTTAPLLRLASPWSILAMRGPAGSGEPARRSQRLTEKRQAASHVTEEPSTYAAPCKRSQRTSKTAKRVKMQPQSDTGFWDALPVDVFKDILGLCTPKQLAMLASTCVELRSSRLIEAAAYNKLQDIPRARNLPATARQGEQGPYLLHFVTSQSAAAAQATAVAFGATHTCMLLIQPDNPHHSLQTAGHGFAGQLGDGTFQPVEQLQAIHLGYAPATDEPEVLEEVMPAVVACGRAHSACITKKGQLMTWGSNAHGQLGHGEDEPEEGIPFRALGLGRTRFISLACGNDHTLAISEHGAVWTCGRNDRGQLGLGHQDSMSHLFPVPALRRTKVVSCAAGRQHSLALVSDGSLYSWGDGRYGQLGHNTLATADDLVDEGNLLLMQPFKVLELSPSQLEATDRVTSVAAGGNHSIALTVGGRVLAFGSNSSGQLGLGDLDRAWGPTNVLLPITAKERNSPRAIQVACGASHTLVLALAATGVHAYSTGANYCGQLGLGHLQQVDTFTQLPGLVQPVALQAGEQSTAAITESQHLFTWGRNDWGQLGLGHSIGRCQPAQIMQYIAVHPTRTLRSSHGHGRRVRAGDLAGQGAAEQAGPVGPLPALFAKYQRRKPRRSTGSMLHIGHTPPGKADKGKDRTPNRTPGRWAAETKP